MHSLIRCFETEPEEMSSHALCFLRSHCSGRRQCEMPVPNQQLKDTKPCPTYLNLYLEVSYVCQPGRCAVYDVCQPGTCRCTVSYVRLLHQASVNQVDMQYLTSLSHVRVDRVTCALPDTLITTVMTSPDTHSVTIHGAWLT